MFHDPKMAAILSQDDPAPVELVNREASSEFVLTCEHAGRAIPAALGDLSQAIGAALVALYRDRLGMA